MKKVALFLCLGILLGAASINQDKFFEITKNIEIFANVYKEINANYVDEIDPSKLMKAGVDAMLNSLDPFTNYISEAQIENYRLSVEGKYNGIGAQAKKIGDWVVITEVYKDYPAFKAGVKVGDKVISVNGQSAKGKESEDLNSIMRGTPKSEVELVVERPGESSQLPIKIIRDEVNIPNVPYSGMLDDETGYIVLSTFTQDAGKNVQDALQKLKKDNEKLKYLVFDLRENGGGLLHEAVEVCNTWLPNGQIVASTRGKAKDKDQYFKTRRPGLDENIKLAVLINGHSASASEIVSGTIQDLDRGVIIGQLSYGKGLVQNTKEVGYNAKVKLTTSKYYIPSGRCIQSVHYDDSGKAVKVPDSLKSEFKTKNGRKVYDGGGITPDIEVKNADHPKIIQKLLDSHLLFNYCTELQLKGLLPQDMIGYEYTDFESFINYLRKNNFDDNSVLEKKIKEIETLSMEEQNPIIKDDLNTIKSKLENSQWAELQAEKNLICNLIEEEMVSRSFYQEGRLKKRLSHDPLITEAKKVLKDDAAYNKILTGK
ncbi:MAG: S41 family peptidase [Saprospiraceae bacterium]|nr:S41 family peptidase [Saprospiraceae bacterium]